MLLAVVDVGEQFLPAADFVEADPEQRAAPMISRIACTVSVTTTADSPPRIV